MFIDLGKNLRPFANYLEVDLDDSPIAYLVQRKRSTQQRIPAKAGFDHNELSWLRDGCHQRAMQGQTAVVEC
jgi:hypothetical protein